MSHLYEVVPVPRNATLPTITWSVSDDTVLKIDEFAVVPDNGKVMVMGMSINSADLTATAEGGLSKTKTISVLPAPSLTLINASGRTKKSKHAKGDSVSIAAGAVVEGQRFDHWELISGGVTINNIKDSETYFVMGSDDVSITAISKYELTIVDANGFGTGNDVVWYVNDVSVSLKAVQKPGYRFTGWTCSNTDVAFDDASALETIITMPQSKISVTANWTEIHLEGFTVSPAVEDYITGQTENVTFSPVPTDATMPKITVTSANASIIDFDPNGYAPENNVVVIPFAPKIDGDTSVTISNDGGIAEETMVVRANADNVRVFVNGIVFKIQHKSSSCSLNGYSLIGGLVSDEFIFDHWEIVSGDATIETSTNLATTVQLGTEDTYIVSKYKAESIKIIPRPDGETSHPADELWGNGNMVTTFSVEPYPKDSVVPEVTFTSSNPAIIRIIGTNRGSYSGTPGNCTITADATVAGGNRLIDTVDFVMTNDCVVTVNGSNAATTGAGTYDYTKMTRITVDAGDPISPDRGFAGWKLIKGDEIQFKNAFGDGSNKVDRKSVV